MSVNPGHLNDISAGSATIYTASHSYGNSNAAPTSHISTSTGGLFEFTIELEQGTVEAFERLAANPPPAAPMSSGTSTFSLDAAQRSSSDIQELVIAVWSCLIDIVRDESSGSYRQRRARGILETIETGEPTIIIIRKTRGQSWGIYVPPRTSKEPRAVTIAKDSLVVQHVEIVKEIQEARRRKGREAISSFSEKLNVVDFRGVRGSLVIREARWEDRKMYLTLEWQA